MTLVADPSSCARWAPRPGCAGQPLPVPRPATPRDARRARWRAITRPRVWAGLLQRLVPEPVLTPATAPLSAAECACGECLGHLVASLPTLPSALAGLVEVVRDRLGLPADLVPPGSDQALVAASWPALGVGPTPGRATVAADVPTARWLVQREQVLATTTPAWYALFLDAECRQQPYALMLLPRDQLAALEASVPPGVALRIVEHVDDSLLELVTSFADQLGAAAAVDAATAILAPSRQ